jgi:hypothetical protein
VLWTAAGVALAFCTVSLNPLVGLAAIVVLLVLATLRVKPFASGFGVLAGGGLLSLFIAYLHREGPGTTCWQTATEAGCGEHLNPLPWLLIGLALVIAGVILHAYRIRRPAAR